jgi:hypothetical protein
MDGIRTTKIGRITATPVRRTDLDMNVVDMPVRILATMKQVRQAYLAFRLFLAESFVLRV